VSDPVDPPQPWHAPAPTPPQRPPDPYPAQYGQPQYGQPQHGQPQYGPPQYGPPQYGPPQHGPPQYGQPQYGPPFASHYGYAPPGWEPWLAEPPPRSRTPLIVALVVAALLVAGAVAVVVGLTTTGTASPGRRIAAPDQVGAYHRLSDTASQTIENAMRDFAAGAGSAATTFFNRATIAAYALDGGDTPSVIAVMIPTGQLPDGLAARSAVDQLLSAAVPNSSAFPPGAHGGALSCGATQFGVVDETVCAWSDSATTGLVASVNPAQPPGAVAQTVQRLRDLID
jgi:hypothetical protein